MLGESKNDQGRAQGGGARGDPERVGGRGCAEGSWEGLPSLGVPTHHTVTALVPTHPPPCPRAVRSSADDLCVCRGTPLSKEDLAPGMALCHGHSRLMDNLVRELRQRTSLAQVWAVRPAFLNLRHKLAGLGQCALEHVYQAVDADLATSVDEFDYDGSRGVRRKRVSQQAQVACAHRSSARCPRLHSPCTMTAVSSHVLDASSGERSRR